jgi:hypothetical protein
MVEWFILRMYSCRVKQRTCSRRDPLEIRLVGPERHHSWVEAIAIHIEYFVKAGFANGQRRPSTFIGRALLKAIKRLKKCRLQSQRHLRAWSRSLFFARYLFFR